MRLLICGAAEAEFANVASTTDEATFVDVVGVVTTCEELISVVTKERVDVCLASSGWMRDLDHIRRYVDIHQVNTPKWVIMTFHLTGALCLEAAHLKVDDLIDLREGFDGFIQRLLLVSNGFSSRDGGFPVPPRWDNSLFVRSTDRARSIRRRHHAESLAGEVEQRNCRRRPLVMPDGQQSNFPHDPTFEHDESHATCVALCGIS